MRDPMIFVTGIWSLTGLTRIMGLKEKRTERLYRLAKSKVI